MDGNYPLTLWLPPLLAPALFISGMIVTFLPCPTPTSSEKTSLPRSVITYDISRVQDHNVIHLENADEKVDLVPRSGKR